MEDLTKISKFFKTLNRSDSIRQDRYQHLLWAPPPAELDDVRHQRS